jgi:hypothetical protein
VEGLLRTAEIVEFHEEIQQTSDSQQQLTCVVKRDSRLSTFLFIYRIILTTNGIITEQPERREQWIEDTLDTWEEESQQKGDL